MQEQLPWDVAYMDVGKGRELGAEDLQAILVKKGRKQQSFFIPAYKSTIVFVFSRLLRVSRTVFFFLGQQ